jgi:phosphoribosylformylglycinamidine synthase
MIGESRMVVVNEIEILDKSDEELLKISKDYLLALNLEEMKKVQEYFSKKGRNPTDAELETIAQTWSEHCVHKTFKGVINTTDGKIDSLFKTFIVKATQELKMPWCRLVFKDNAGIIEFDDNYDVAMKVETHNHPTALDPYGGAGTGSGGVFRDIMGVGAKPILSTDVLFFGPINYPSDKLPKGAMHPKRSMKGSVAGIRDYGNKMGIPTANGGISFDEGYAGNPLVYAGCVGIIPKGKYVKNPQPGDVILLVGGKTGRDGIHGVTFASLELSADSKKTSSGAVQIGNPIEEKRSLDAILRARDVHDKPLYSAITDCGGGGLSSAAGEMGKDLGIVVDLEKVPLKYAGLEPWEIWISEAQERMLLAVPKKNLKEILKIFDNENSQATVIGEFTGDKKLVLRYNEKIVADLDMNFVHESIPRVVRKAIWKKEKYPELDFPDKDDLTEDLKKILASPNVASKEWVIRHYDHEVQAKTVIKPLHGINCDGPGDACVLKPVENDWRGIVVSNGVNSKYSIDPYNMTLSVIDEAIRNNICCGGRRIALLDNFSWGNPEKEDRLGQLVESCKACYDGALAFETPFISGKDSLYNEFDRGNGETVSIPPTLVISSIGIIPDVRKAITMDLKEVDNPVYIIGETKDELGGSHYYMIHDFKGNNVPTVDLKKAKKSFDALIKSMDNGLIKACHDCSEGGIGVAAAEMAFAGELGMNIDLKKVSTRDLKRNDKILFSESNSRFLVEVDKSKEKEFEKIMKGNVFARIGEVTDDKKLIVIGLNKKSVVEEDVNELKKVWKSTFNW